MIVLLHADKHGSIPPFFIFSIVMPMKGIVSYFLHSKIYSESRLNYSLRIIVTEISQLTMPEFRLSSPRPYSGQADIGTVLVRLRYYVSTFRAGL